MTDELRQDQCRLGDIPVATRDEVKNEAMSHTVGFIGISGAEDGPRIQQFGMGTYVEINGRRLILTAAHVVDALASMDRVGFVARGDEHAIIEKRNHLGLYIVERMGCEEWGPDLGFIEVPYPLSMQLDNSRVRFNLSKRRGTAAEEPTATSFGMWGIIGTPEALSYQESEDGRVAVHLRGNFYASCIVNEETRRGYDYKDVSIRGETISFGGVSGGGLWQTALKKNLETGEVSPAGRPSLEGVVFYQGPLSDAERFVRCHGKRSIYRSLEPESWIQL